MQGFKSPGQAQLFLLPQISYTPRFTTQPVRSPESVPADTHYHTRSPGTLSGVSLIRWNSVWP